MSTARTVALVMVNGDKLKHPIEANVVHEPGWDKCPYCGQYHEWFYDWFDQWKEGDRIGQVVLTFRCCLGCGGSMNADSYDGYSSLCKLAQESVAKLESEFHFCRVETAINAAGLIGQFIPHRKLQLATGLGATVITACLRRMTLYDHTHKRPLTTSIVVAPGQLPSKGFFEMARELDYKFTDEYDFWNQQVTATFAYWKNDPLLRDIP